MAAAVAAAAAGSSGGAVAGGAAGGPIVLAIVIALIITKEMFKARRNERREKLKQKYPPIQVASAAQRLKNILGENGEMLSLAELIAPSLTKQPILQYSYSQDAVEMMGPAKPAPGLKNPNWAFELAEALLEITGGNLNKIHPYNLPRQEYIAVLQKIASGEVDKMWRDVSNTSLSIVPGDWKGNAYFSADGTFLGIDLTGNSTSNNQVIVISEPLPNDFYLDPLNKIINPNSMLTMDYEYLDVFLIRNKNKMGFDKIAEKIFTRIGESVGVKFDIKLGNAPEDKAAYTDQNNFHVYVNEDMQQDLWKDYRNINAARNLLYHESLHQKGLITSYYGHAEIYLKQLMHETFPNSGTDYQVEQIQIFVKYVLRAAKEEGADIEEVKQLVIEFNNNLARPNYEIQPHLDGDNPYIIFYGERFNFMSDEVQNLQIN